MIQCVFGAKGGVGTSTIAQALAYEKSSKGKTLLIDGSFREKSQDLLNNIEVYGVYDFYDLLANGIDAEDCIVSTGKENLSLLVASSYHLLEEVPEEDFISKLELLIDKYQYIIVDLSRWWISDLIYWSKVAQSFIFVSTMEKLSLRGLDRLNVFCFKEKILVDKQIIFNKIKSSDDLKTIEAWNKDYEMEIYAYIKRENLKEENLPVLDSEKICRDFSLLSFKKKKGWFKFISGGIND